RDKTKPHWVVGDGEDGGNRCGRPLGGKRRSFTDCGYHSDHPANQIGRQRRQPVNLIVGPAVFDRDVLALDISGVFKSLAESAQPVRKPIRRLAIEEPNHRHRRLLRPHRQRPHRCRAAEQRYELAARYHSITSSARSRIAVGIVTPSALAALRLTTVSNVVACWTGRSAGF